MSDILEPFINSIVRLVCDDSAHSSAQGPGRKQFSSSVVCSPADDVSVSLTNWKKEKFSQMP